MGATAQNIGLAPFQADEAEAGITDHTMQRMQDVQSLIDQGESEENIARYITSSTHFTPAERTLAKIVLARHGLRFQGQARHPLGT